jgi:sRNA-binding protein
VLAKLQSKADGCCRAVLKQVLPLLLLRFRCCCVSAAAAGVEGLCDVVGDVEQQVIEEIRQQQSEAGSTTMSQSSRQKQATASASMLLETAPITA